jgi:hypothetical protein
MPGMRKNGARSFVSPSAALSEALPSSISWRKLSPDNLWNRRGWFWLWAPIVSPAAYSRRTTSGNCRAMRPITKKRRLDAFRREDIKNLIGVGRQRPIIEGEDYLLVSERQRLGILHRAKPRVLAGSDDEHPARAESVEISWTALCVRGRGDGERAGNAHGRAERDCPDCISGRITVAWFRSDLTHPDKGREQTAVPFP